jgi:hypothetical protein
LAARSGRERDHPAQPGQRHRRRVRPAGRRPANPTINPTSRNRSSGARLNAMAERRWLDRTQPQTLYIAVILMYINAALTLLFGGLFSRYGLLLVVGYVAAGYGIANEKKWGYGLGLAMAFLPFLLQIILFHNPFAADFITLLFEIALVALLLHPQSREYQRIWFK